MHTPSSMRIILLNQYYAPDGAATAQMLSDLGAGLAARGHQVTAVCCDRSYANPERRYPKRESIDGVDVHRVRTTAFGRGSSLGRLSDYATYVAGVCRELLFGPKPDVVIVLATPPMIAFVAVVMRMVRRFKVVFWSMDVYPDLAFELGVLERMSAAGRLLTAMASWVLRSCDAVVALGETMGRHLRRNGASRVAVVHNWADEGVAPSSEAVHQLRCDWQWDGQFVLLYSGNLGLAHEFDTIIAAARQLRTELPHVRLAFVGSGPRLQEVKCAADGLDNVEFHDPVERSILGDLLTAADVHLVTLRRNMSGLLVPSKIYGVLAAGRPTIYIGPPGGEIADIIREGECGAVIANGDVAATVATIRAYMSDDRRRAEEGANARALFERRFTRRSAVESFAAVVEAVADPAGLRT